MDYSRQSGFFKPERFDEVVHVIGAGATGSWMVLALAKMGISRIHVWDYDVIEEHNIPNQAFSTDQVGELKAVCASHNAELSSSVNITYHNEKVDAKTRLQGVVFMLVDSMSSRSEIYYNAIKNKPAVSILVETRMGGDVGFVYTLDAKNQIHQQCYEGTLYKDDVAETSLCGTSIAVLPTALQIVGSAIWQFVNYTNKKQIQNCVSISTEFGSSYGEVWE